jgi:hypothetical protein
MGYSPAPFPRGFRPQITDVEILPDRAGATFIVATVAPPRAR